MKIEKLPSGSYRVRKMYKGQNYTLIFDYKPTQKEVLQAISQKMDEAIIERKRLTFETAAEKYMSVKENVISPSSITGYKSILRLLSDSFRNMLLNDITQIDIQKEMNDYSVGRSPKTVRNAHGFISAVIKMFRPNMTIATTLPQKEKKEPYIPTDEEVKKVLEHSKGSRYEIVLLLATFGLRRSEICALTPKDFKGNTLTINKALVKDKNNNYVLKSTKTTESTRQIYVPDEIVKLVKEKGCVYDGHPNKILDYLNRTQDQLNIPRFKLHAFRHYYASMSHSLGIPDSYIMQSGGWKSDHVLKTVYRHAQNDKNIEMQQFAAQYITELIDKK